MKHLKRLRTAARANAGRVAWLLFEAAVGAGVGVLFVALYLRGR